MRLRFRWWLRLSPRLRSAVAAVLAPGAVTLLAILPSGVSSTSAATAYVLAVVAAVIVAGLWAGLVASVLSFLALNFFFTPPLHALSVSKTEDFVALLVFLLVSINSGLLLSRALSQRARAERRESEARLLHDLSSRLLSGTPTGEVLGSFGEAIAGLFGLARCEITTDLMGPSTGGDEGGQASDANAEIIPMMAKNRTEGRILAVPGPSRLKLSADERKVLETFATQMALALEGRRLAVEAQEARLEAETSRARAALFSSVTHDLRTPLSSITASVTSLLDADLAPADRRELLETIRHEAERLNRLVGNLLDLSRIRAGAVTPVTAPVAVDEVIEGVLARLEPVLKDHEIHLKVRGKLPEIPADVTMIDQVLTNLLENAAKFAPPGTRLTVVAGRWQSGIQVRITDQGPGIPPELREKVFEPFVRDRPQEGGGAGLGLSIARELVLAHGGRIWIEGAPGGGTAVVFELPGRR